MIRVSLPNCRNAEKIALTVVLTGNPILFGTKFASQCSC